MVDDTPEEILSSIVDAVTVVALFSVITIYNVHMMLFNGVRNHGVFGFYENVAFD